jgi:hypothetical protein
MADWTNLLTGLLGAGASIYSANQQSNAIQNAAAQAAQQSQFRPVGITTRFGTSGFQYNPATGQLVGAGYQVAPDVAAQREALLGLAGGQLSQAQQAQAMYPYIGQAAQGLFGLGLGYLGQTPQGAAQNWMSQQQQLLAPGREQELARLTTSEFNRGTLGLGVGATREGYMAPQPAPVMQTPSFQTKPIQVSGIIPVPETGGITPLPFGETGPTNLPSRQPGRGRFPDPFATPQRTNKLPPGYPGAEPAIMDGGGSFAPPGQQRPTYGDEIMGPSQYDATTGFSSRDLRPIRPGDSQYDDYFKAIYGTPQRTNKLPPGYQGVPSSEPFMVDGAMTGGISAPPQSFMSVPPVAPAAPVSMPQGLAASNPRFAALYNARAMQDAQLAAQAQQAGMQQAQFGQGLLGGALGLLGQGYGLQTQALAPFSNYFAGAGNIENLALQSLAQGTGLGSAITAGSTAAAQIQQQAANQAAQLAALRNQAAIAGLSDPVAALIGALTRQG